ncbi:MAG: alpha/beta fold hydrolase [Bacteroidota bacterium]
MKEPIIITAYGGHNIHATFFPPPKQIESVVLIVPGVGIRQRYYASMATYLAEHGMAAYTYDYHGIGASKPKRLRGFQTSVSAWAEKDTQGMLKQLRRAHPGKPLYILAHSGGGTVLGLATETQHADKILLVASPRCLRSDYKGGARRKMWLLTSVLYPVIPRLFGYFPNKLFKLGENLPKGVALEWGRWGRNKLGMAGVVGEKMQRFSEIKAPISAVSFDQDFFAGPENVKAMQKVYTGAPFTYRHFSRADNGGRSVGHFCFFKSANQEVFGPFVRDFFR